MRYASLIEITEGIRYELLILRVSQGLKLNYIFKYFAEMGPVCCS